MISVLHPITRLIIGGAQENTMLTADLLNRHPQFAGNYAVSIVSGTQTGSEGSLIEEVQQRQIPLTLLPALVRQISPLNDFKAFFQLRKLMKKGQYQIVHTHSSKAGILGRLAAKSAGIPIIIHTVHGWSFHDQMPPAKRRFYIALEKLGMQLGNATIVVTDHDIAKGVAQGIGQPTDYTLIRSGIELDRFGHPQIPPSETRRQLGIPENALVVGSVTRLSPQKAPLDLIETFAHIAAQCSNCYFLIIGDGSLRPQVESQLVQTGIANRTILTGLRRDIPELLAIMDLFILTSLWEGLPRVLPQAMATGLPIVCTAADGSAEAITDGVNGFLVPRAQPEAMSQKSCWLLAHPVIRSQMGNAGKQRAPEFAVDKMVQQIANLYQQLYQNKE